ncbi:bifunctional hydroxymethylpyrimidine kinase/phosphomethylpyrimidine kinase [Lichenifustis flavocetrariae]|uniref:hydroxymethylpyrimidine kinase n=1 Tax=Lichenifustis flavocetrariae TaxID=2949735 RepID=A0AA41Z2J4_9HYPH|nr:bifunctional hydroxymethylpyrimidine kinase/phosphomethylpyrimidine kinase [Lichenifustis flavocetrariae]MCW6511640.1 bifunctional hydroxymethylpyrimidine kinase/phosphomethylpyrimidine kinase [Lichenifustis flavocetrariae]
MTPNLLSIAGSDPSGGAGIQADLKTFSAFRCYGMAALTALTAQNTRGVTAVHVPPPQFLKAQIDAIYADIRVDAVKIGMLATGAIVSVVADRLKTYGQNLIVIDPVLVATSGDSLGAPDVVEALRRDLLPLATLVTPNLPEAARLAERPIPHDVAGMRNLAEIIHENSGAAVLIKGGHLNGPESTDILFDGHEHTVFSAERVETPNTHGTGCTLSAAIAACLAQGANLIEAIEAAKDYLTEALLRSGSLKVGGGHGPVQHFHALWPETDHERLQ